MPERSINKVILVGRLGKDAETKFTTSGMAITTFTLATNRRSKDGQTGDWKDETDWHNIVLFKAENVANYLLKGKQVFIEGRIQSRSWDDKDGVKRYKTEIVSENLLLLGGGGAGMESSSAGEEFGAGPVSMPRSARPAQRPTEPSGGFDPGIGDDDVPF